MSGPRILCDAVPFGYGPIGKLLTICARLPASYEVTLLAANSSYELAQISSFDKLLSCDTEDPTSLAHFRRQFTDADLFINVMNPVSADYASSIGTPMVHVDSLFWMWDQVPPSLAHAATYFVQNFVGVDEQLKKFHIDTPAVVGAIIDDRFRSTIKGNQLLINIGGLRSKLIQPGKNSNYPTIIAGILERVLGHHSFPQVLFTGDKATMSELARSCTIPNCRFEALAHDSFLRELGRSSLLLTSPGLTTTYEAFGYGVPVVFLPPQNLSQFLILKRLRQRGAARFSVHWLDYYPESDLDAGLPEEDGVRHVLACIQRFEADQRCQRLFQDTLAGALLEQSHDDILSGQDEFIEHYGATGAIGVADAIVKLLSSSA